MIEYMIALLVVISAVIYVIHLSNNSKFIITKLVIDNNNIGTIKCFTKSNLDGRYMTLFIHSFRQSFEVMIISSTPTNITFKLPPHIWRMVKMYKPDSSDFAIIDII